MKALKSLILLTLLLPTFLRAENVAVGTRQPSEEVAEELERKKAEESVEEEAPIETAGYIFDRYPSVYYANSVHRLTTITILDNNEYTLELEDGSVWKIGTYDGRKALNWRLDDPLAITQNNRWFSRHNYRIINKANGTSVEATLFLGPVFEGEFSRFIVNIDHTRGEVLLNDNTRWEVAYVSTFKDWAVNDYIIIGTNSNTSFWGPNSEAILINVNMNNYVEAKQF